MNIFYTAFASAIFFSTSSKAEQWVPYTDGRVGGCNLTRDGYMYGCTPQPPPTRGDSGDRDPAEALRRSGEYEHGLDDGKRTTTEDEVRRQRESANSAANTSSSKKFEAVRELSAAQRDARIRQYDSVSTSECSSNTPGCPEGSAGSIKHQERQSCERSGKHMVWHDGRHPYKGEHGEMVYDFSYKCE